MTTQTGRTESAFNAVWRLLVRLAIIAGVLFACYRLRNVITTLFVAAIFAYAIDPIVQLLTRWPAFVNFHAALINGMSGLQIGRRRALLHKETSPVGRVRVHRHVLRLYATIYALILSVFLIWHGTRFVVRPFAAEFKSATAVDPVTKKSQFQVAWERGLRRYDRNPNIPDSLKSDQLLSKFKGPEIQARGQQIAAEYGTRVLEGLKNIVEIVILPVLVFYFLVDGRKLKHEFISLVPRKRLFETMRLTNEFNRIMRSFIVGQFILCLLAGVVVGVGLALLGVPFPFTLGVLAGITRAIPIIGPIIGGIPIVLLTLATRGPGVAAGVLGFFTFLHFAESKFIMPLLIGDRMELHPVLIIIVLLIGGEIGSLLIGGSLGSLLGMFFAAPVAALLRVMIRRYWLHLQHASHHPPTRSAPHRTREARSAVSVPEGVETLPVPLSETLESSVDS